MISFIYIYIFFFKSTSFHKTPWFTEVKKKKGSPYECLLGLFKLGFKSLQNQRGSWARWKCTWDLSSYRFSSFFVIRLCLYNIVVILIMFCLTAQMILLPFFHGNIWIHYLLNPRCHPRIFRSGLLSYLVVMGSLILISWVLISPFMVFIHNNPNSEIYNSVSYHISFCHVLQQKVS